MRKSTILLLLILSFLIPIVLNAQVRVRGYYRKDGTYVRPHMRSNPDGIPQNNYSYPGNTNPYTGKVASGNPSTYLNNYNESSVTNSKRSSLGSTTYTNSKTNISNFNRHSINSGKPSNFYYVTASSLKLRTGPSTNSSVITTLSGNQEVEVIKTINSDWKKVKVSYVEISYSNLNKYSYKTSIGYVSSTYLSSNDAFLLGAVNLALGNSNYSSFNRGNTNPNDNEYRSNDVTFGKEVSPKVNISISDNFVPNDPFFKDYIYSGKYIYVTTIGITHTVGILRDSADINSRELYKVPLDSKVFVLDNQGTIFYKVHVNGLTGYLPKGFLVIK